VIRPGAFNGVVAYKGTFGWADMTGIKPYAPSLDTLGFFAREANDLALIAPPTATPRPIRPPRGGRRASASAARLWWDEVEPYNQKNIETAARALRAAGARVRRWQMPESWQALLPGAATHHDQGGDAVLRPERRASPPISPSLTLASASGDAVSRRQLAQAKRTKRRRWPSLHDVWERFDFLLAPSAKARRRRASAIPATPVQPLLDAARHALHRACPSTPARSACRWRCSWSARCALTII
jgi:Asp-tRNA(Asn)/Glu-tRNA(Gln) amidotransferase A subunit family amidase